MRRSLVRPAPRRPTSMLNPEPCGPSIEQHHASISVQLRACCLAAFVVHTAAVRLAWQSMARRSCVLSRDHPTGLAVNPKPSQLALPRLTPTCQPVAHPHSPCTPTPPAALMSSVYEDHKDEDGFLYITYSGENTFGGLV